MPGMLNSEICVDGEGGSAPQERERCDRVRSLDVVRGFTVLLMIFVDNAGSAYAVLNHSPWDGLTIADVVMPFFLFMVGASVPLALGKRRKEDDGEGGGAGRKIASRVAKLFVLGLVLQGGGFPSGNSYTWGYSLTSFRVCGILQRIAVCYGVAACLEMGSPKAVGGERLLHRHDLAYVVCSMLLAVVYLGVTYGVHVPSFTLGGQKPRNNVGFDHFLDVECDKVGSLGVRCNAAGLVDRTLFGRMHLYSGGAYARMPECSSCSPGYCPITVGTAPHEAPPWCSSQYHGIVDPEGTLSTLLAIVTTLIGALFSRSLVRCKQETHALETYHRLLDGDGNRRGALLLHWSLWVFGLAASAFILQAAGIPFNKQLWTPTYCLGTAALCGGTLAICAALVGDLAYDKNQKLFRYSRTALEPFRRVGKNALLLFVLGASDVFNAALSTVYYVTPHDHVKWNIVSYSKDTFRHHISGDSPQNQFALADLLFTLATVLFWAVVAWVLDAKKIYWTV